MTTTREAEDGAAALGFRPLYRHVKEQLVRRIAAGVWAPGQILPSEMVIAAELGVSQGTARKALDEMTAENLLVRRQGKGTFVASHDDERVLFRFFRLTPDTGEKAFPESEAVSAAKAPASEAARLALGLAAGSETIVIQRIRLIAGSPAISETIHLPAARFPGIEADRLPNNLYGLYATRFGVGIARASEKLKAVACPAGVARDLGIEPGAPIIEIDRLAYDLDGKPVEWRLSLCRTDTIHYGSDLR